MTANAVKTLIKSVISSNKVVVFSKSYCPFCDLAKNVLRDAGAVKTYIIELDHRNDSSALQNELTSLTKVSTVPYVFINKKYVGGGTTVENLHNDGQLAKILSDSNFDKKEDSSQV